jgi:hypothetical protein
MPGRYGANGDQAIAASPGATIIGLTASTLTRAELLEVIYGAEDTPADNMIRLKGQKYTAAGTSTAVTPDGYDDADPAGQLAVGSNHTVEPTYAGIPLLDVSVHLRSTFIWKLTEGQGIIIPATAANGFGLAVEHGSATNPTRATFRWRE